MSVSLAHRRRGPPRLGLEAGVPPFFPFYVAQPITLQLNLQPGAYVNRTCMYTCVCMYTDGLTEHVCIRVYVCTHMYAYTYVYVHVRMCVHMLTPPQPPPGKGEGGGVFSKKWVGFGTEKSPRGKISDSENPAPRCSFWRWCPPSPSGPCSWTS